MTIINVEMPMSIDDITMNSLEIMIKTNETSIVIDDMIVKINAIATQIREISTNIDEMTMNSDTIAIKTNENCGKIHGIAVKSNGIAINRLQA